MGPIQFARTKGVRAAPCYNLVAEWLRANGATNVPSDSAARRQWLRNGSEAGARWAASQIGLVEKLPRMQGDICLIAQEGAEPLLGVVLTDGFCVARAFGRMFVGRAEIIVSWGLPCRQ
jgi:hypothetical protein